MLNSPFSKLAVASAVAGALGIANTAQAETTQITFLLTADVYEMSPDDGRGGFAKLSSIVETERANNEHLLYVHAGDAISPSLMSSFDQGKHIIELLNFTPPDIFVPGNHEFDFGPEVYKQRMQEAEFGAILAANMTEQGELVEQAHKLYEFGDVKVGVYGLAAQDTPVKSSPGNIEFANAVETAAAQRAALEEMGADIIVAVTHSDVSVDRALIANGVADVILSGDDHVLDIYYDGRTAFAEPISDARSLVAVDLTVNVEMDGDDRDIDWWPDFRVIDSFEVSAHPAVDDLVQQLEGELSSELDVALGTTETMFDSTRATVRGGEAAIGNLIADAMRAATGADIALTNGGGIRAGKTYAAGDSISRRHILEELPFGNVTIMLGLTGEQIVAALENGVSAVEDAAGRFPHVSNMTFTVDLTKAAGNRVSEVMIAGEPLDLSKTYEVATNDYIANGGDGYAVMRDGEILIRALDGQLIANDVMVYIRDNSPIAPSVEGRVNLVR